ncbi:ATP synthase F0 subunit C [Candidatus Mycoplasma pogonae]
MANLLSTLVTLTEGTTNTTTQAATQVSGGISIGKGLMAVGAGLAMIAASTVGVGQGIAVGKAVSAIGRNPEAEKVIRTNLIIGLAIAETSAIYGFVIALILIFVG